MASRPLAARRLTALDTRQASVSRARLRPVPAANHDATPPQITPTMSDSIIIADRGACMSMGRGQKSIVTGPRLTTAKVTRVIPAGRTKTNERTFATFNFFKAHGSPGLAIAPSTAGVELLAKLLTSLEVRSEFLGHLDGFAGARVSAHT